MISDQVVRLSQLCPLQTVHSHRLTSTVREKDDDSQTPGLGGVGEVRESRSNHTEAEKVCQLCRVEATHQSVTYRAVTHIVVEKTMAR